MASILSLIELIIIVKSLEESNYVIIIILFDTLKATFQNHFSIHFSNHRKIIRKLFWMCQKDAYDKIARRQSRACQTECNFGKT